jgi:hypothetical protein
LAAIPRASLWAELFSLALIFEAELDPARLTPRAFFLSVEEESKEAFSSTTGPEMM